MSLSPELLAILVCPKCKSRLEYHAGPPEVLICRKSRLVFRVESGIPVMLIDEALPLEEGAYPASSANEEQHKLGCHAETSE